MTLDVTFDTRLLAAKHYTRHVVNLSAWIAHKANRVTFIISLIAYAVFFPLFFFGSAPFSLTQMHPYSANGGILDAETFYTAEQAYVRLASFGEQGRQTYQLVHLGDMVYPAVLGAFMAITLSLLLRRITPQNSAWRKLNLLPIANMLMDYLENVLLMVVVALFPAHTDALAGAAGVVTLAKSLFGMLSFIALGIVLVVALARGLMARRTAKA